MEFLVPGASRSVAWTVTTVVPTGSEGSIRAEYSVRENTGGLSLMSNTWTCLVIRGYVIVKFLINSLKS